LFNIRNNIRGSWHDMGLHSRVDIQGVGIFKLFKLTMSETMIF
jgi:hypothetical protein